MAVRDILQLGNPLLYESTREVEISELDYVKRVVVDLHDTMMSFRENYGIGRAIAAPQIGEMIRLVYMNTGAPTVFINPVLDELSEERMELWDDCMSFPDLLVRVERHQSCRITYRDLNWALQRDYLSEGLSELLQHECDHLDGILAVSRAIDSRSFSFRQEMSDNSERTVRQN
ncbi:MAG: peptide deformylase [Rhodothermales bacterium]|nr:peptide deformylase [Rhodothermales bacterium]